MEKEVKEIIIEPIGKDSQIDDLDYSLDTFKSLLKERNVKFDIEGLEKNINDFKEGYNEKYKEVIKSISQFFGKYVLMRFSYNTENDEGKKEHWIYDYEAVVFLYCFVPSNSCLFGIYCVLNNDYIGGVQDTSINLKNIVENHRIEIKEISKEDFIMSVEESVHNCLKKRLNKIASGKYKLTDNGYIWKNK
jgi:hypothetical protein